MLPQLVVLTLLSIGLGIALVQHGTPNTGTNNFWVSWVSVAIWIAVLSWGGFFEPMGW